MKKLVVVLLVLVLGGLAAAAYVFRPRFESQPPQISIAPNADVIGMAPIEISVSDPGLGLKSVTATLSAGGTEHRLLAESYGAPESARKFTFEPAKLPGLKEGEAVLRVVARDASLRNSFSGNETVFEKKLTIDVTPPTLELVADVTQGVPVDPEIQNRIRADDLGPPHLTPSTGGARAG